jgi:hypothetical protein
MIQQIQYAWSNCRGTIIGWMRSLTQMFRHLGKLADLEKSQKKNTGRICGIIRNHLVILNKYRIKEIDLILMHLILFPLLLRIVTLIIFIGVRKKCKE